MSDTIAAIATGNVLSAIGILRLSGDGVLTVIDRVFRPANGRPMSEAPDRKLVYGAFCDTDGQTLDLCLCTVSRAPHSYTGEDTAELQCHGSPAVLRAGLQALFAAGARQALAGEFTKRAFLNGRMDLTQAEAVSTSSTPRPRWTQKTPPGSSAARCCGTRRMYTTRCRTSPATITP